MLLLLLLQQSACISVQSMRYKHGLNIQFSGKGNHQAGQSVRKPSAKELKWAMQTPELSAWMPDTLPGSLAAEDILANPNQTDALRTGFAGAVAQRRLMRQVRQHQADTDRYKKRESGSSSKTDKGSGKTSPYERSAFSVMLYAITGLFIGMLCVIMFILALLTVPLVLLIAVIAMLIISYYGIEQMRKGWAHARERSGGFQLLYILLCAPGFIVCGLMYLLGWMVLEGFFR